MDIKNIDSCSFKMAKFSPELEKMIAKARNAAGYNRRALAKVNQDVETLISIYPEAEISVIPSALDNSLFRKLIKFIRKKFFKIDVSQDYRFSVGGISCGYIKPIRPNYPYDEYLPLERLHDLTIAVVDHKTNDELLVNALLDKSSRYLYNDNRFPK